MGAFVENAQPGEVRQRDNRRPSAGPVLSCFPMFSPRRTLLFFYVLFLSTYLPAASAQQSAEPAAYDLIIQGGHIIDGTGNPWYEADLGIRFDRIVAIG